MAYTDVISLSAMKTYLRVDDGNNLDDTDITNMLNGAFALVEKHTNIIMDARAISYPFVNAKVAVYDTPINSVTSPAESDMTVSVFSNYRVYEAHDYEEATLTLNVGYTDPADVPYELKEAVKMIVKHWYYSAEEGAGQKIPAGAWELINSLKRFIF